MSETIEIKVGSLYANLHEGFVESLEDQYEERARQTFEAFIHEFNQQVEREQEQMEAQQASQEDVDLEAE